MAQLTNDGGLPSNAAVDSRVRIIETLWAAPGLSRIELADVLAVDKSTMSRAVARLIETGLVRESEAKDSGPQGGRRRVGLEINPDWGVWMGLELQPDRCRGALVNLAGAGVGEFLLDAEVSGDALESVLAQAGAQAVSQADELGIPIRGAALAVPGVIRPGTGVVERSRPLGITAPLDMASVARSALGRPVTVENDVNCGCRSEMHFIGADVPENFLYLFAEGRESGLALGLGTVIGGTLHRGDHGASGEFLSVYRARGADQLALDHHRVRRAGRDPAALAAVAGELAPQLAMMANALDIDRLVLGGLFRSHFSGVSSVFAEALLRRRTYPDLADLELVPAARGDEAAAYGAAIHFTENLTNQEFWRTI